eukprot:scaffold452639_cov32-Prasinocladus_malaysianus.AAC.1
MESESRLASASMSRILTVTCCPGLTTSVVTAIISHESSDLWTIPWAPVICGHPSRDTKYDISLHAAKPNSESLFLYEKADACLRCDIVDNYIVEMITSIVIDYDVVIHLDTIIGANSIQ